MRPECRSYCCHFSHRSCLTSCFTFYSFFTTLVATRRCRCLLRSARVNVMPERLLSVISGILAGGIPGFRIELCCFHHPLTWPLCVIPCFLCFASCSVAILNDTQDVIMHVIPFAGSDPTSLCFLFVLVWLWLCVFGLLGFFWFWLWFFLVLAGTARWTVYRSTTSTFVAIDKLTALHDNYNSSFCCD